MRSIPPDGHRHTECGIETAVCLAVVTDAAIQATAMV